LLVITYDEHGGNFDHVAPPPAVPPSPPAANQTFAFDRYGVRVPAVIVSPYVKQGTVLRPPGTTPFDHTSIIATLRKRFSLGPPLTERDGAAPDLEPALTLSSPDNRGPERIDPLPYQPSPTDLAHAQSAPLNHHQRALLQLAAHLPDAPRPPAPPTPGAAPGAPPGRTTTADFLDFIKAHLDSLKARIAAGTHDVSQEIAAPARDVASAAAFARTRFGNLFRSL
jgi:hypothetical protein